MYVYKFIFLRFLYKLSISLIGQISQRSPILSPSMDLPMKRPGPRAKRMSEEGKKRLKYKEKKLKGVSLKRKIIFASMTHFLHPHLNYK